MPPPPDDRASTSRAAAPPPAPLPPPHESHTAAVSQLAADPQCGQAAEVLSRLLSNIAGNPLEEKFRRVRLTNPKVQAAVVDTDGGVELLLACGFHIVFERQDKDTTDSTEPDAAAEEGFAVLPVDADVAALHAALVALKPLLPAPAPAPAPLTPALDPVRPAPAAAAQPRAGQQPPAERVWAAPCPRGTRVLLPVSVESDLPPWFFERTGAELKASFMAAVRQKEQDQVLMTREMRERLRRGPAAAAGRGGGRAAVKVRLPEGIAVQGEFDPGEPVAAVFAWVASCLSDPLQTYALVLPDRQQLATAAAPPRGNGPPRQQSVREAGLAPSTTLNLAWTGASAAAMRTVPALRAELLREAEGGGGDAA